MRSMRARLLAGADRAWEDLSPTWRAPRARSGGSWRRCSASPSTITRGYGRLGLAFQHANFIRDVREDYKLDRIYLPGEERERFGVAEADFGRPAATPALRALVEHEVAARARCSRAPRPPSPPRPPRCAPASGSPARSTIGARPRRGAGYDVLGRRLGVPAWQLPLLALGALRRDAPRHAAGDERTPLEERADVLICGASFAGPRRRARAGRLRRRRARHRPLRDRRARDPAPARRRRPGCARWASGAGDPPGAPRAWLPHAARLGPLPAAVELERRSTTASSARRCGSSATRASRSRRSRGARATPSHRPRRVPRR